MSWKDILEIRWDGGLLVGIGWLGVIFFVAIGVAVVLRARRWPRGKYGVVDIDVPLPFGGSVRLRRTDEVVRIAHAAWTEIVTRKAGLRFDPENDLIEEVYNSWYELFAELRKLTRSVPGEELRRSEDARKLVDLLIRTLNEGLRPHLTKHQARFRHWLEIEKERSGQESGAEDPQTLEKRYPFYEDLAGDLGEVHSILVDLSYELRKLAHGDVDSETLGERESPMTGEED